MGRFLLGSVVAATVLAMGALVSAAGFHISEQGAKAMGMANAFAAQADDPSALFYNPAGIAFQKGTQASLGVTVIDALRTEFKGTTKLGNSSLSPAFGVTVPADDKARGDIFFPPNFYATTSLENLPLSFGVSFNAIYPLAKRWNTNSPFRDEVTDISITPLNFQSTVAYRIDQLHLAVAAGLDYTYAKVALSKSPNVDAFLVGAAPAPGLAAVQLGNLDVDGTGDGWGYNVGLLWKPVEQLSFGLAYRSEIRVNIDGNGNYQNTAGATAPQSFGTSAATSITLPDSWSFAAAYKPVEKLTIEFDADLYGWNSFDKLAVNLGSGSTLPSSSIPKNWENSWTYRFGAQYAATPQLDLRAGYAYDTTPVPDATLGPELPDADRHNASFGLGIHNERGALDIAYMWVHFVDRNVNNSIESGAFKSDVHLVGANVTFKF